MTSPRLSSALSARAHAHASVPDRFPTLLVTVLVGFALLCMALGSAGARAAAETPQEEVYLNYQIGLQAVAKCRDITLSHDQQQRIGQRIDTLTGTAVGAGRRLFLIEEAKEIINAEGCDDPVVTNGLAAYDANLASAAQ
ncbi:hypothetical protein T8K17_08870 [Thalassobaculum sp. OXR-137]|uniref:hypothetical protein n=1 Tax=Thalassobaculum sp. OXR-137 TaxID=3100173 RepID=UPI002AC8CC33|nr:hypothetical protein [Thalassobaculum sp. OXR-137]WPZ36248.1 hypothetical protein T8K17_08870 [Thalassobaculum sp. OXR-137]